MRTSLLCLALVAVVAADRIPGFVVPGKCPAVDERMLYSQQKPNYQRYAGTWYEIALTNNPYQLIKQCVRNEYTYDGTKFNVRTTGTDAQGNAITRKGQVLPNPFGEPHLSVDYEESWMAPYVILDTDYENFSCIYSCAGHNFGYYADFAFIFSRSPTLADRYYRRCEAAFMNIGVDPSRFSKTAQGASCSYNTNYRSW
ncbi:crustacyanin subunit C [Penaeus vannamei]|uniref:Crustacyanin subunit C n=1 Tax=Penaeus vannamei TaxID=6689 RepID=A0A423SER3_PENVA|nr:crustacyanin-A1 subunit-like [Penaeus vannamei]ROT62668.1 crustacyanin subunit C [Penaeus vannamei]